MDPRLRINIGEELIQIDGNVFKIPKELDLVDKYGKDPTVLKRTSELAAQYGTAFTTFSDGISCLECSHTSIYSRAMALPEGQALFQNGADRQCGYKGNTDIVDVFVGSRRGLFSRNKFMAKREACSVFDAFHRALFEKGYLKEFQVSTQPGRFQDIREFRFGGDLEKKAASDYR